ncbi:MAG: hypothetical protein GC180_08445 [Bacteroidetes bacterium]|nr:hypothetical protein [Bacteroidota bacterium]
MLFIRSFSSKLAQTELLAKWLEEVSVALENIPYHRLRFVVHEAFVNACKYSATPESNIVVMIRQLDHLEITVADPGKGFSLPEDLGSFDKAAIGFRWNLVQDRETRLIAEVSDANTLHFSLEIEKANQEADLKENHRGLISILKAAQDLHYHFVPNSFNYLHITC